MRRTSIEELNEEISDLEESDAEESDAKSSDLSSSASEEEKSEVGSSDSDLEDSSIESNSTQKEQDNRREKRFSDLEDSLKNLANDEVTQEQAFRFHILADKFLAPKEGQIIPQYDDLFVIRRWFWINELEVLDNLSPFDFLFQKVNMDVLSPKYYKDIGVLRQESSIFLKYPEGLVRSFHYHFVSIIEEKQILTKFKEVYEAYKASLSNKESDEYKKAESQISFIIEVCNINDVFSHKGIYLTTFSPELLTFLLELNIQFDNVDFIERVYKERPELISREFLITHKAKLSGIWDLEKEFLQAVEQVNLAEIKKLIDRKVNISSTQSCQELLDQKIGTSSLRELSQNQFFRNGHPVNALFLCATIIHEDSREEIWAYLVFKGIRVRIPWQNGLDTDTYSAFDYFTDLNKNIKLRNFAQRIQSRINAMSQKLSQTIQCNLESMTSIIPSSLAEKTSLSVRNIYDAIFDSELHRGGNSVGYNFGKIDKETFALIKPILQVISSDYSMNITVDLASKNIGNLLSYSNTTIPRGMYYGSNINVGALPLEKGLLGTIIHEMCHAVCAKVFENDCLPYRKEDTDLMLKYNTIFKLCKTQFKDQNQESLPLFQGMFNDKSYPTEEKQKAELIVRIPQFFIIHGYDEAITKLNEFPKDLGKQLINFYNNDFIPVLNKYVKTVQQDFLKQELKKFDNISTHFASHDDEVPEMGVHESTIMLSMQDRPSCCSIS